MATIDPAVAPSDDTEKSFFRKHWYVFLLATIFCLTLLTKFFIADVYYIPSQSMYPTINGTEKGGDMVFVNKLSYFDSKPHDNDVVVFKGPKTWDQSESGTVLIKRVIANGGQTIALNDDGQLTVDGVPENTSHVGEDFPFKKGTLDCHSDPVSQRCFPTVKVPAGSIWVLGDNRAESMDSFYGCRGKTKESDLSSCQGAVSDNLLIGKGEFIAFPVKHIKKL